MSPVNHSRATTPRAQKAPKLVSTSRAAEILGVTVAQFTRLMAKLGIEHDDEYPNPHYRSGPPAKLWSKRALSGVMRRKEVKEYLSGAASRSASARAAAITARVRLMAEIDEWEPTITVRPVDSVITAAIESYNDFTDWGDGGRTRRYG